MFGIAVWDQMRRRGVIARDRLGIKPLYYAEVGDLLVFASELKSLLASGLVPSDLDYEAIDAYLTLGFFPAPATPLAAVRKLEPGCVLVVEDGAVEQRRYWAIRSRRSSAAAVVEDWSERLLAELEESVRLRLMSDVPLGAMLSGGLDSSLIVALMARQMTEPVKTFSVGFAEAGAGQRARRRAVRRRHLGTDHHELELSFSDETISLDRLVWHLDEPLADLSSLGFLALSGARGRARDRRALRPGRRRAARRLPQASRRVARRHVAARAGAAAARAARGRRARPGPRQAPGRDARRGRAGRAAALDERRARFPRCAGGSSAARSPSSTATPRCGPSRTASATCPTRRSPAALYLDAQLGLADDMLHYFDRASMAHSLEVRVPFLDHHVVEFCATIPAELKVRRLETKHVLKHAARGLVPDRIIDKPKIGFFNSAVDGWFRAQTHGAISDYLLGPNPRYAEIIDRGEVARLVKRHADGSDAGHGYPLLSILMLEVWLPTYLPRALAPGRRRASASRPADAPYAVITPARDEAENLPRLAESLAAQTVRPPRGWSSTTARRTARASSSRARSASTPGSSCSIPGATAAERGAPIVRALHAASRSCRRSARHRRQRRRRHLVRAGLLRAAARRASSGPRARDRERYRLRARGRRRGASGM